MKIKEGSQIDFANKRFNQFHDGYLRRISIARDTEFFPDSAAWDRSRLEELWSNGTIVEIEIRDSNYDTSKQPAGSLVTIRAKVCTDIIENLEQFVGRDIFDLRFLSDPRGVQCVLTYHRPGELHLSMENGIQVVLFVAESIEIQET
jgi:hypothetical protein